jgi:hypothetical protein
MSAFFVCEENESISEFYLFFYFRIIEFAKVRGCKYMGSDNMVITHI